MPESDARSVRQNFCTLLIAVSAAVRSSHKDKVCFTTEQQKSHVICAHTHTALTTAGVGSLQATLPYVYDQPPQSALNGRLSLLQNLEHLVDVIRW